MTRPETSRSRRRPTGDETELLAAARAGDEGAFAALVEPHRAMLHTVCYRITGDDHEAHDALQNALLAAWRNLDRFREQARLSTWLYRIAHNCALGIARRRVPQPVGDAMQVPAGRQDSHAEAVVEADAVRWALARIPPDFRSALVLREYAGMSYREIAETQEIKVETVKTRIARARRALAALLEIEGGR